MTTIPNRYGGIAYKPIQLRPTVQAIARWNAQHRTLPPVSPTRTMSGSGYVQNGLQITPLGRYDQADAIRAYLNDRKAWLEDRMRLPPGPSQPNPITDTQPTPPMRSLPSMDTELMAHILAVRQAQNPVQQPQNFAPPIRGDWGVMQGRQWNLWPQGTKINSPVQTLWQNGLDLRPGSGFMMTPVPRLIPNYYPRPNTPPSAADLPPLPSQFGSNVRMQDFNRALSMYRQQPRAFPGWNTNNMLSFPPNSY